MLVPDMMPRTSSGLSLAMMTDGFTRLSIAAHDKSGWLR
jgi:hypothetical protein